MSDLRDIEERLRKIEIERLPEIKQDVANGFRRVEDRLDVMRERQDDQSKRLAEHHDLMWGTPEREGLISWRRTMEKRMKMIGAVLAALATTAFSWIKDIIKEIFK
jgi:hypothetical protein